MFCAKGAAIEDAFAYFRDRFEIIAVADNNPELLNTSIKDVPVITPAEIRSLVFDFILICTNDEGSNSDIFRQLVCGYMISPKKILENNWFNDSRILSLLMVSNQIEGLEVQGAVAEFGVFLGDYAAYINKFFYSRKLFLYDTFEGFREDLLNRASETPVETRDRIRNTWNKRVPSTSESIVLDKMILPENCILKKGFFPQSVSEYDEQFVFVNIDTDLYEPILAGLDFFYPRMVKGGVIFIHDYFGHYFPGVRKAVEVLKSNNDFLSFPIGDRSSLAILKS